MAVMQTRVGLVMNCCLFKEMHFVLSEVINTPTNDLLKLDMQKVYFKLIQTLSIMFFHIVLFYPVFMNDYNVINIKIVIYISIWSSFFFFFFFSNILTVKSFEIVPICFISEFFALNWHIFIPLTNKKLLLLWYCRLNKILS